ncbi:ArdC-like ssDNA-binding domain-containing protein [Alicyclobacillus sendaiensis]|uniref:ArdC-like ssDNA-binding domain-containing protein n=1 Tax=Alicyclobacillus sendaiensis PA2 TaxID=3029425 RepID=A0ABT6Y2J0_ALISE|nr:ArdC-like ssDNA-binding domain-containing protein [Alicyclobacillus sendaiensis]MDI9261094.1 ArdC-like ssDNA-binding domain-containing protein [Alicyclobacillus sendaiensis PA2]
MTNCVRCARNLRAEPSIRRGAGPVCAKWLLRQVGWTGRVPKGWSATSDVRVQRFLKRPLVSPDIPDEQAPIISTHGALEAIAPQARPLESYSVDELRHAVARVPSHLAAEYRNEAYDGPNRELYQRARALGLNEANAAQWAQTGTPPASVETDDEVPLGGPSTSDNPDDAQGEASEQRAFVTHSRNPKVQEAFERLNALLDTFEDTEQYKGFLSFVARAPRYSFHNVMLIYSQRPTATVVMGYKKWQEFGRHVMRGEHGIDILAPLIKHEPVVDDNGNPVLDENGKPVKKQKLVGFKTVKVFDIRQTDGDPIPLLDERIEGDRHVELRDRLMRVIKDKGIPISFVSRQRLQGAHGRYLLDERRIQLSDEISPDQATKTLIHEYAHAILHSDLDESGVIVEGGGATDLRRQAEIEAESVAYIVASAFGFDTSDYSVGYVHGWSGGDKRKLRASIERITKTAQQIIEEIEKVNGRSSVSRTERGYWRFPARYQLNGELFYRDVDYVAVSDHIARGGTVSFEPRKVKINGREIELRASVVVGNAYGSRLEVADGDKLLVRGVQVHGYSEPVDLEIDPQDIDLVTLD